MPGDDSIASTSPSLSLSGLSIRVLLKALFHLWIASSLSFFAPLVFRWWSLPSSLGDRLPLEIHFTTCADELHGVCSFPTAIHRYEPGSLFSDGINYEISLDLILQDPNKLEKSGVFQIVTNFFNENGKKLAEYSKIVYPKKSSGLFAKVLRIAFFPLYLVGFFGDEGTIVVPITATHLEIDDPSAEVRVQFQSKYILVESAYLSMNANFGLIRSFLAGWPLTSYLVIYASCFCTYFAAVLVYLGFQKTFSTG